MVKNVKPIIMIIELLSAMKVTQTFSFLSSVRAHDRRSQLIKCTYPNGESFSISNVYASIFLSKIHNYSIQQAKYLKCPFSPLIIQKFNYDCVAASWKCLATFFQHDINFFKFLYLLYQRGKFSVTLFLFHVHFSNA